MIYITGATGHIGNNVVREMINRRIPCEVLVRKNGEAIKDLPVAIHIGDIFNDDFLSRHLKPGDTLIHVAGVIDLTKKQRNESTYVNVEGTKMIADFCSNHQIHLVYVSSVDAINKPNNSDPIYEPSEFDFSKIKSHYAKSKAEGTAYILSLMNQKRLKGSIVYPSAVIGPDDYKPSAAGKEIMKAHSHHFLPFISGGYNFIDVRDTAKAICEAAVRKTEGSFILSAHEKSIKEFYQTIGKVTNQKKWMFWIPSFFARFGTVFLKDYSNVMIDAILENYHYVNKRMVDILKITPIPFEQTVRDTIAWFEKK